MTTAATPGGSSAPATTVVAAATDPTTSQHTGTAPRRRVDFAVASDPNLTIEVASPLRCRVVVVTGGPDRRIAALASRQYGRVARRQLLEAGLSDAMIGSRLHSGHLTQVARGVYAVGHTGRGRHHREVEALLSVPSARVLSHLTAARLWGLHEGHQPIDVSAFRASKRPRSELQVHRPSYLGQIAPTYLYDLPVTPVPLTLVQIASLLRPRELERAVDEALGRGLTSIAALERIDAQHHPYPACALLRQLVANRLPGAGLSYEGAEQRLLDLLRDGGFPEPLRNISFGQFSVDFYWPHVRMAIEVDSYQWHALKRNFERDRCKDIALKAQQVDVVRLTWDAITRRRFETVATLAQRIVIRERELGVPLSEIWIPPLSGRD